MVNFGRKERPKFTIWQSAKMSDLYDFQTLIILRCYVSP